ncbi:MAG TPA: H-NS histone family protein [Albitalea sp.]|uniref:H-NS histone family protein n=1 Tax=Piscinibacter sp. TaxID=1903157 RepID=UPI002ECFB5DE
MAKAKTYAQVQQQIQALQREAETLRRKEAADVVARIKEAITAYGITAEDLGFGLSARAGNGTEAIAKRRPRPKATATASAPKYQDTAGNTWSGRGPRPQWLKDAISAGKTLQDFAV